MSQFDTRRTVLPQPHDSQYPLVKSPDTLLFSPFKPLLSSSTTQAIVKQLTVQTCGLITNISHHSGEDSRNLLNVGTHFDCSLFPTHLPTLFTRRHLSLLFICDSTTNLPGLRPPLSTKWLHLPFSVGSHSTTLTTPLPTSFRTPTVLRQKHSSLPHVLAASLMSFV